MFGEHSKERFKFRYATNRGRSVLHMDDCWKWMKMVKWDYVNIENNIFNRVAGGRAAPVPSLSEVVLYEYI